jgi:hypothetical protein
MQSPSHPSAARRSWAPIAVGRSVAAGSGAIPMSARWTEDSNTWIWWHPQSAVVCALLHGKDLRGLPLTGRKRGAAAARLADEHSPLAGVHDRGARQGPSPRLRAALADVAEDDAKARYHEYPAGSTPLSSCVSGPPTAALVWSIGRSVGITSGASTSFSDPSSYSTDVSLASHSPGRRTHPPPVADRNRRVRPRRS